MSFIVQRISGATILLREHKRSLLIIGRGTNAQLRSENPSVALEHAVIEANEGGFDLVDRGSITGTYLNGRAIETARVGAGDSIEIGDLVIEVKVAQPGQPLFLRVSALVADTEEVEDLAVPVGSKEVPMRAVLGETLKAPKVDYLASYQLRRGPLSKSVLAAALSVVVLVVLAVLLGTKNNNVFRPGDISVAHTQVVADGVRLIGDDDCVACHEHWGGAPDTKCQACHKNASHRAGLPVMGSCSNCHAEHRQLRNLADVVDRYCVDCHGNLRVNVAGVKNLEVEDSIVDFERTHPDFTLVTDIDGVETRLAVDSIEARSADRNSLKFNHECHLSGKCNKRPPTPTNPNQETERLTCGVCHVIDAARGVMMPVSYEKTCARCHPLTFDNRFPPVPHGLDLQTVAGFIANAYSGNESMLRMSADEVSRVFAQGRARVNVASTIVRNAQRTLEARCKACHEIEASGTAVVPPVTSRKWLAGMKEFDHRAHLNESTKTECADCHQAVVRSAKATDLSMPGIRACRTCHRSSGEYADSGIDTCQTCHYFHELSRAYGEGWTLEEAEVPEEMRRAAVGAGSGSTRRRMFGLPFWAAVTLPLALVVFVGIAGVVVGAARSIGRRPRIPTLSGLQPAPKAASKASPVVPPKPKAEAEPPGEPPAAKTPPPSALPDRTVAMDISELNEDVVVPAGKTIATEYFGSILFISGPLEGRRYTIDSEEGCYIGRDKSLASIVIDDGRISRRHVWVGVRGDSVMVVDQNSTNGTYLKGEPSTRITEYPLKPGDVVVLGERAAEFRFEA